MNYKITELNGKVTSIYSESSDEDVLRNYPIGTKIESEITYTLKDKEGTVVADNLTFVEYRALMMSKYGEAV